MKYDSNQLEKLITSRCQDKSLLMPRDDNTKPLKEANQAIAEAITETHNNWQDNTFISNVVVNGGVCVIASAIA